MESGEEPKGEQLDALLTQLEDRQRHSAERQRQWLARMEAQKAEREAQAQHLGALNAEQPARPPLQPEDLNTTIAQVRRMIQQDVHPTWMHAAYADLAGRLAHLESGMQDLEASLSLLHTKMETLIGQLAVFERQDPPAAG